MMWRLIVFWEDLIQKINKIIQHIFKNLFAYLFFILLIFVICQRWELIKTRNETKLMNEALNERYLSLQKTLDSIGILSFDKIQEVLNNQIKLGEVINKSYERLNLVQKVLYELVKKEPLLIFKVDTIVIESLSNKVLVYYFAYDYDKGILKWEGLNQKQGFVIKDAYKIGNRSFEAFASDRNIVLKIKKTPLRFYYRADLGVYFSETGKLEPLVLGGVGVNFLGKKVGLVIDPMQKRMGIAISIK